MRLLVVEDDPRLCAVLARGLREAGYGARANLRDAARAAGSERRPSRAPSSEPASHGPPAHRSLRTKTAPVIQTTLSPRRERSTSTTGVRGDRSNCW